MVSEPVNKIIKSIESSDISNYALKLCGAGGHGFILLTGSDSSSDIKNSLLKVDPSLSITTFNVDFNGATILMGN